MKMGVNVIDSKHFIGSIADANLREINASFEKDLHIR